MLAYMVALEALAQTLVEARPSLKDELRTDAERMEFVMTAFALSEVQPREPAKLAELALAVVLAARD